MSDLTQVLTFVTIVGVVFVGSRLAAMLFRRAAPSIPSLVPRPAFGSWTKALADLIPLRKKARDQMAKELVAAGNFRATAFDDFLAKRNAATGLSLLFVAACFGSGLADGRETWIGGGGALVAMLVFALPRLRLGQKSSRRIRQLENGLPDALDMIAMSVSSGVTLEQTIRQIAHQMRKTHVSLAEELEIVARQASLGSIEHALDAFARRIDLPEVTALCVVVAQSHSYGGRMVDSLEQYATRIRRERKNRAERAGNTASIKLLLPVVTCLCPPIAVMLVGPALVDFKDFLNRNRNPNQTVAVSSGPTSPSTRP